MAYSHKLFWDSFELCSQGHNFINNFGKDMYVYIGINRNVFVLGYIIYTTKRKIKTLTEKINRGIYSFRPWHCTF